MAERLTEYDFKQSSHITKTERRNYPWHEWFDGSIWRLTWGVDFDTHPLMMERVIRTRATSRKIKLSIRHEGDDTNPFQHIVMQCHGGKAASTAWKVSTAPRRKATNEEFAMANPVADTPVRSKRPVRPKGAA